MTQRDAMMVLFDAVREVTAAGYAVTGNLHFVRMKTFEPHSEGRLGTVAEPHAHLRFTVTPPGVNGHPLSVPVLAATVGGVPSPRPSSAPTHLGEACFKCGATEWIQSGACKTCAGCGESGGCG